MQRDHIVKDGALRYCDFIMESAKELSEDSQWDPDTSDLQTDEERYTETRMEVRNGIELTIRRKGVRPKAKATILHAPETQTIHGANFPPEGVEVGRGPDLNAMGDADLETLAARVGCVNYPKGQSKAKRVAAVREAMNANAQAKT